MRTLLRVSMDVAASNKSIMEGSLPKVMQETIDNLKPEAAYFFANNGKRSCFIVFDMKDSSQIPSIAEPFFMGMNAEVDFCPVMNRDELQKGLSDWMKTKG